MHADMLGLGCLNLNGLSHLDSQPSLQPSRCGQLLLLPHPISRRRVEDRGNCTDM